MTLDEFKGMLAHQKKIISDHLQVAQSSLNVTVTTDDIRSTKIDIQVYAAKLDLITWILSQTDQIETHKPKMREFL